jgi:hypothetical protein
MMRNLFSIMLNIVAGFFFYTASLLCFINDSTIGVVKWWIVLGFTIPALIALCGGLALKGFQNWQKNTGIVLLSSSGVTAFMLFTFACMLMSEELRMMMKLDALTFFSDYLSGGIVVVGLAVLGFLMVKANKVSAEQYAPAEPEKPRR